MIKYMSFICFLLFLTVNIVAQNVKIESAIESLIATKTDKPFNGVILISQDRKTKYKKAVGYSDLESKTPLTLNSQFIVGSISKQFTAVLVLQMYEKGKIDLFIPISKYLPQLPQSWANEVTVHQLLSHTHGIRVLDKPLAFPAGSQYEYSQIGYDLLAHILEKVTGDSFVNLSSNLFGKCGMKNTYHPEEKGKTGLVNGYTEKESGKIDRENRQTDCVAAGGFASTAKDLLIWNRHLYGGKLLKKDTYNLMMIPKEKAVRNHPVFGMTKYGYGITTNEPNSLLQFGQTGYAPGFVSMNFYFPDTKTSVIVLENITYDTADLKKMFYYHTNILEIVKAGLNQK